MKLHEDIDDAVAWGAGGTSPERPFITFGDRGFAAGRRASKCEWKVPGVHSQADASGTDRAAMCGCPVWVRGGAYRFVCGIIACIYDKGFNDILSIHQWITYHLW